MNKKKRSGKSARLPGTADDEGFSIVPGPEVDKFYLIGSDKFSAHGAGRVVRNVDLQVTGNNAGHILVIHFSIRPCVLLIAGKCGSFLFRNIIPFGFMFAEPLDPGVSGSGAGPDTNNIGNGCC